MTIPRSIFLPTPSSNWTILDLLVASMHLVDVLRSNATRVLRCPILFPIVAVRIECARGNEEKEEALPLSILDLVLEACRCIPCAVSDPLWIRWMPHGPWLRHGTRGLDASRFETRRANRIGTDEAMRRETEPGEFRGRGKRGWRADSERKREGPCSGTTIAYDVDLERKAIRDHSPFASSSGIQPSIPP